MNLGLIRTKPSGATALRSDAARSTPRQAYDDSMGLRLKHLWLLARDIGRFSLINRVWWFIPMMVLLGLIMLAVTTTQAVVPVAVYTLF